MKTSSRQIGLTFASIASIATSTSAFANEAIIQSATKAGVCYIEYANCMKAAQNNQEAKDSCTKALAGCLQDAGVEGSFINSVKSNKLKPKTIDALTDFLAELS